MPNIETETERRSSRGGANSRANTRADLEGAVAEVGALVEAHPVGALATALGVGYALGGGLFTRFTSRLVRTALRLGVRFALLPVLERELAGLATAAPPGGATKATDDERVSRARTRH